MTTDLDKQTRIERHKTIRMALIFAALLVIAAVLFGVYRFVTAPVRMAQNTTQSITQNIEETATAVLTQRHIRVNAGRTFARLADNAHAILVALPETKPATMGERAFRLAHLRGSDGKVCRFTIDFGAGLVPVWTAADNSDFETNQAMGGDSERQVRIVFETSGDILGVSVQYAGLNTVKEGVAPSWHLLWRRRDSLNKPLSDVVMSERAMNALSRIPEECSRATP